MTLTTVRHIKDGTFDPDDPNHVYIGRPVRNSPFEAVRRGSPFANPYRMRNESDRDNALTSYLVYLSFSDIQDAIPELRGKTLYCWCKRPDREVPCHGDILKAKADALAEAT